MKAEQIFVSIMLGEKTYLVGRLWHHRRHGHERASFEYSKEWLEHPKRFALEPALKLTEGVFYTPANQVLFGGIADSAPDRWGRLLIHRMHQSTNQKTNRSLSEIDYLLGVHDQLRQGALRFSKKKEGPYLSFQDDFVIPPLMTLPKLLSATQNYLDRRESLDELKLLLFPASSMGGARPKAVVKDQKGNLLIAKFSRQDDDYNVVVWEAVALTLAQKAGIGVPRWTLKKIAHRPVLLIERFDRNGQQRIPFLSAMTMLGAKDREQRSYLEIAYALMQNGSSPNVDRAELWRRLVFNILISNTDDHLQNHGFLYQQKGYVGWRLSPAYDMNPMPQSIKPRLLTTFIDFENNAASLDTALSVIEEFKLTKKQAYQIISEVTQSVVKWKTVARRLKLSSREIDYISSAFEHEDLKQAKYIK